MGTLTGKRALVTGTSQGIGAAISKALIEAGCDICMHYFHSLDEPQHLKEYATSRKQRAICLQADLTNEQDVMRFMHEAGEFLGGIDILVNNSGALVQRRKLTEVDNDFWQSLVDINMKTMMMVTRESFPLLNKTDGASIINISSLAGRKGGHPGSLVYSTCKGAVLTWTRGLSTELGPLGIRVNAVAPGFIQGTRFHQEHTSEDSAIKTIESIPLGRSGKPEDVARAVVFLASEYDGFITGETIDINGGVYCA
jgi:3-oxoacyl-[acyl-carrier protein] reductase